MDEARLLRVLKALADPKRFRMVQEIAAAGELSCGQIVELFALSQPTISHHLQILTDAGIIVVRPEAKHHFISVNQALLNGALERVPGRLSPSAKQASRAAHKLSKRP